MKGLIGTLFTLLFLFMPTLSLIMGQSNKASQQQETDIKMRIELVLLDALVMQQKTGRIVGELKKEDFVLYEDGIKQQITHFSQDSLPLSVILLVDRGGCLDPYSDQMHRATLNALNRLRPQDDLALMTFEDKVELVKGFRFDRKVIADYLDNLPEHDEHAEHCFNIALFEAAKYMRKAGNPGGRRVIIVITGITKSFDCNGPSSEEARLALLESGSVVCAFVPSSTEQRLENGLMNGVTGVGGIFKAHSTSLNQFADETGGEIITAKREELDRGFNDLITHIRTRYSLGFTSTNTKNDGSFRKLKLEVTPGAEKRQGKLVVKARRSYRTSKASSD
jgi:VWFA-related protein